MAVRALLTAPEFPEAPGDPRKRNFRWRFFQIAFALTYIGIVLDIVTTALGYAKSGSSYEQNPFGGALIGNLGWIGMFVLLSLLCCICYVCVRAVYWRMSTVWSAIINTVIVLILLVRWLAVVTAVIYLLQPAA